MCHGYFTRLHNFTFYYHYVMFYTFTAYIDLDPDPGRMVVATASGEFSDQDKARIFARGFAWETCAAYEQPVDVAFRATSSEFTLWEFCPIF